MWSFVHAPLLAFFVAFTAVFPAHAETGPWIKNNVIEARLVLARDAKQHFAGVEIIMQPGWHTYWRYTGASGIPPSFDFSAIVRAEFWRGAADMTEAFEATEEEEACIEDDAAGFEEPLPPEKGRPLIRMRRL